MDIVGRQMKLRLGIGAQSSSLPPEIQDKVSELLAEQVYEYWSKTNEFNKDKEQGDGDDYKN